MRNNNQSVMMIFWENQQQITTINTWLNYDLVDKIIKKSIRIIEVFGKMFIKIDLWEINWNVFSNCLKLCNWKIH